MKKACLVPGCRNQAGHGCKGMCVKCWGQAKKAILAGETSLKELEKLGMIESSQESPFTAELAKRQKETKNNAND